MLSYDAPAFAGGRAEIILNLLLPAFAHRFETQDRTRATLSASSVPLRKVT